VGGGQTHCCTTFFKNGGKLFGSIFFLAWAKSIGRTRQTFKNWRDDLFCFSVPHFFGSKCMAYIKFFKIWEEGTFLILCPKKLGGSSLPWTPSSRLHTNISLYIVNICLIYDFSNVNNLGVKNICKLKNYTNCTSNRLIAIRNLKFLFILTCWFFICWNNLWSYLLLELWFDLVVVMT